jgi:hypothetical protein
VAGWHGGGGVDSSMQTPLEQIRPLPQSPQLNTPPQPSLG